MAVDPQLLAAAAPYLQSGVIVNQLTPEMLYNIDPNRYNTQGKYVGLNYDQSLGNGVQNAIQNDQTPIGGMYAASSPAWNGYQSILNQAQTFDANGNLLTLADALGGASINPDYYNPYVQQMLDAQASRSGAFIKDVGNNMIASYDATGKLEGVWQKPNTDFGNFITSNLGNTLPILALAAGGAGLLGGLGAGAAEGAAASGLGSMAAGTAAPTAAQWAAMQGAVASGALPAEALGSAGLLGGVGSGAVAAPIAAGAATATDLAPLALSLIHI